MHAALSALGERRRVQALREYAILDTPPEPVFDDLTKLAARCCGTPAAAMSLVDEGRLWFKSRVGLAASGMHRERSFCAHTILQNDLLIVTDAALDPRFRSGPFVEGDPPIRFYAGAPLIAPTGEALGTLFVLDFVPRTLSADQQNDLRVLARQVMAQLELRRRAAAMAQQEELLRTIFDSEPQCVKLLDLDGTLRLMNRAGLRMIGAASLADVAGCNMVAFVADEFREAFEALIERVAGGEHAVLEFQTSGPGAGRWLETHAVPLRDEQGAIVSILGITRDITEQQRAHDDLRESEKKFRSSSRRPTGSS
jgi:PAS domain S-box-containing protein